MTDDDDDDSIVDSVQSELGVHHLLVMTVEAPSLPFKSSSGAGRTCDDHLAVAT